MESDIKFIKSYYGLTMLRYGKIYMCIDKYEEKVRCSGSLEDCNEYFKNFVDYITERR